MSDEQRLADPAPLLPYLPPASAIIVRRHDPHEAEDMARALSLAAAPFGVKVLLSAPRPPARLDAYGLHIPEAALHRYRTTDLFRLHPMLVTASAHSAQAIQRAARLGVDAILLSPVFTTDSHANAKALGLMRFAAIAAAAPVPVVALGGIDAGRIRRVLRAGADGIAGIGLFRP